MPRGTNVPTCGCGECSTCKHRVHAARWRAANPGKVREAKRAWKRTESGRACRNAQRRARYAVDPEPVRARARRAWREQTDKLRARNALNAAVRYGRVVRQPCEVCGNPRSHGHHDDYTKPLDVRWLCGIHHAEAHA